VLLVYGYSYKALIKEKFGDGIMSAIGKFVDDLEADDEISIPLWTEYLIQRETE